MSWSVSIEGTKDEVTGKLDGAFAAAQTSYAPGTLEGDDIVAAKGRVAAFVTAYAGDKRLAVSAYGSHSNSEKTVLGTSLTVSTREIA